MKSGVFLERKAQALSCEGLEMDLRFELDIFMMYFYFAFHLQDWDWTKPKAKKGKGRKKEREKKESCGWIWDCVCILLLLSAKNLITLSWSRRTLENLMIGQILSVWRPQSIVYIVYSVLSCKGLGTFILSSSFLPCFLRNPKSLLISLHVLYTFFFCFIISIHFSYSV